MTAQKGKDLLLKVDTDGGGTFATVAGLRARTLGFNAATVDVTDRGSGHRGVRHRDCAWFAVSLTTGRIGLGLAVLGLKVDDAAGKAGYAAAAVVTRTLFMPRSLATR